jgi:hypothetical protein
MGVKGVNKSLIMMLFIIPSLPRAFVVSFLQSDMTI